jgi:hypothetical protein
MHQAETPRSVGRQLTPAPVAGRLRSASQDAPRPQWDSGGYLLRAAAAVLLFMLFADASPARAHPPYEYLERVITDESGRQLQVFKSYTDGIFFTDPVTLVIRDANDRTVADTGYSRNVAMACWRGAACAVFRYDEFWSVLPERVWRLERDTLVASDSRWLAAIGVIAPLWDDAAGYAVMFATIAFPAIGLWLFRQTRSRAGQVLLALAAILTGFYALMWLYTVALLSRLLLHAVALALVAGSGGLALLYWSAVKSARRRRRHASVRRL